MEAISNFSPDGKGLFYYPGDPGHAAEMEVSLSGNHLTVYHTEVKPEFENQGLAKGLLAAMVAYARANQLQVVPLCPFVSIQFRRHPDEFGDLWKA